MNKLTIDLESRKVVHQTSDDQSEYAFDSKEAFELISDAWLNAGWDTKHVYSFSWLGRPIIQLPEDMLRLQEVLYKVKPDLIIETGVAHGGSLIFFATLCKALNKGRVLGVDIEIRPHNRKAIEEHELFSYITLIEGSSVEQKIVDNVKSDIKENETVFIMLDSCHTKDHVLKELYAYAPLVSVGSYIVAADGIMNLVVGAPRTSDDWKWNNPKEAALEFVKENPNFIIDTPDFDFNESSLEKPITYWPSGYIKRIR